MKSHCDSNDVSKPRGQLKVVSHTPLSNQASSLCWAPPLKMRTVPTCTSRLHKRVSNFADRTLLINTIVYHNKSVCLHRDL